MLKTRNLYAILEVNSKPFLVAKNDLIIIDKQLSIGDLIKFDRIREVGNSEFKVVGNPFHKHCTIVGRVMEHVERKHKTFYQKRSGRSVEKVNSSMHSIVRISSIDMDEKILE